MSLASEPAGQRGVQGLPVDRAVDVVVRELAGLHDAGLGEFLRPQRVEGRELLRGQYVGEAYAGGARAGPSSAVTVRAQWSSCPATRACRAGSSRSRAILLGSTTAVPAGTKSMSVVMPYPYRSVNCSRVSPSARRVSIAARSTCG
ncbi:hypothetical protein [Actinoplanes sp. DH11]|uniref:hypothetical protein n=1 Tax=Actinoplanes sp. DH11 TaxID=2857011 RepID=UPI001E2C0725|nr:hypothetical protein [Actinoplanes sp. DH11]